MLSSIVLLAVLTALPPPPPIDDDIPPPAPSEAPLTAEPEAGDAQAEETALQSLERYFPTTLDEELHPEVEAALWTFFLGGVLPIPFGAMLVPFVLLPDLPRQYLVDSIIAYLVHAVPVVLTAPFAIVGGLAGFYAGLFGLITGAYAAIFSVFVAQQNPAGAGACLAVPLGLLCFAGSVAICEVAYVGAILVNTYWCVPVAIANAANRGMHEADRSGAGKSSAFDAPPRPGREASLAMAY